jgi:hypothetical protein
METKKTALNWIIETLYLQNSRMWKDYIQEAKEMEKAQIRAAYEAGVKHNEAIGPGGLKFLSEEYYTDNYDNNL